jgi:hypothetical protein
LIATGAWSFTPLGVKRAGIIRATIYTPASYWDLSRVVGLERFGLRCEYLVNFPWLVDHPVLAIREKDINLLPPTSSLKVDMSSEISGFVSTLGDSVDGSDFDLLAAGRETLGSVLLITICGVVYCPLLPSVLVAEQNGRMSFWGSLAFSGLTHDGVCSSVPPGSYPTMRMLSTGEVLLVWDMRAGPYGLEYVGVNSLGEEVVVGPCEVEIVPGGDVGPHLARMRYPVKSISKLQGFRFLQESLS